MWCSRPNPRGSLSGVDPDDEKAAWYVPVVETSKAPSKDDWSSSSAGALDVVPTMSRVGEEGGREKPECWGKARFSAALVVAARIVYLGDPVFNNDEIAPVKELLVVVESTEVSFPEA